MGAVSFDKDAVYIDIGRANYTKKENLDLPRNENDDDDNDEDEGTSSDEDDNYDLDAPAGLLKSLQDVKEGVDQKMKYSSGYSCSKRIVIKYYTISNRDTIKY